MSFPADVTINLCGLNFTSQQVTTFNALERSWKAANTDYLITELELSCKSPLAKQVNSRSVREEVAKKLKLAGMRWECKEGSPTGILTLWASSNAELNTAEIVCRSGQAIRLSVDSKESQDSIQSKDNEIVKLLDVKTADNAAGSYIRWPN